VTAGRHCFKCRAYHRPLRGAVASVNHAAPELVIHGVNLSLGRYFDATVYGCGHSPICRGASPPVASGRGVASPPVTKGAWRWRPAKGRRISTWTAPSATPPIGRRPPPWARSTRPSPTSTTSATSPPAAPPPTAGASPTWSRLERRSSLQDARFSRKAFETHYLAISGTRMACLRVSGLVAAFLSVCREFIGFSERVKEILLRHRTNLGRDLYHQRAGMPNLVRMLGGT
jgi:hypothetical protein